ncbi:MAG: hypothetical protein NTW05_23070 [Pseudonocardiales bacterium]|nr:hypothetical protein [Pseudonocardiales bacterium]
MALRVAYRSSPGGNDKPRPPWFGKDLALRSLLRAAERLAEPPVITFYNDGELPPAEVEVMAAHGTERPVHGGSNRASFRAVVAAEAAVAGGPDDLVWFAEDDYLYSPESLTALVRAAAELPDADFFAMYGSAALAPARGRRRPVRRDRPGAEGDPTARPAGGVLWYRGYATTSTFGVRAPVLRADARLLRTYPYSGGAWDTATCLAYQGYRPFGLRRLLPGDGAPLRRALPRAAIRAVLDVRALRRTANRRVLVASDPELVWHMEVLDGTTRSAPSAATTAVDRARVAAETVAWAAGRGLPIGAGGSRVGA